MTDISGRSLILQGLVVASTVVVSQAVLSSIDQITNEPNPVARNRNITAKVAIAAVVVGATVIASQTVLKVPKKKWWFWRGM